MHAVGFLTPRCLALLDFWSRSVSSSEISDAEMSRFVIFLIPQCVKQWDFWHPRFVIFLILQCVKQWDFWHPRFVIFLHFTSKKLYFGIITVHNTMIKKFSNKDTIIHNMQYFFGGTRKADFYFFNKPPPTPSTLPVFTPFLLNQPINYILLCRSSYNFNYCIKDFFFSF